MAVSTLEQEARATDPTTGLTSAQAAQRLAKYGINRLVEPRQVTFWSVLSEEVREPLILLLLAVAVVYSLVGKLEDVIAIVLVVAAVVAVEVYTEYRAKNAVLALKHYAPPSAPLLRDGKVTLVQTEKIVPGDILILSTGERIAADARLLEAYGLAADEAHLTGESVAAEKRATGGDEDEGVVHAGSVVARGRGIALVTATGMNTAVGRLLGRMVEAKEPKTPLQLSMKELAGQLLWASLALSALVVVIGLLWSRPWQQMVLTGLTVAFATIPEELPILITIVLGIGAYNLAKQSALVKKLYAAETMGSVTVVATDKTGTLTLGRLGVAAYTTPAGQPTTDPGVQHQLIEIGVRASDVPVPRAANLAELPGDQIQIAFYLAAAVYGDDPALMRIAAEQVVAEFGFDGERGMLSRLYATQAGAMLYVTGAPEAVVAHSTLDAAAQAAVARATAELAGEGLRVVGLATRCLAVVPAQPARDELEQNLEFAGLVGLLDQPRPEAAAAISELEVAGVRTIMVTGDHPRTAANIAAQVGISGEIITGAELTSMTDVGLAAAIKRAGVFARTSPDQKLRIVEALQRGGEVVAVTGDGVNDAPALQAARVGVAMGKRGTDLAREAAAVVLLDDNFATLVLAVAEGRRLFANLSKAIAFYLACKLALIVLVAVPTLFGAAAPFQPIQIVVMELFMDLAASSGFVAERAEADLMRRPPRPPDQPFLRPLLPWIGMGAAALVLAVGLPFVLTLVGTDTNHAQTVAYVSWLLGSSLLALNMSSQREPLLRKGLLSNPILALWPMLAAIAALVSVYIPTMNRVLFTVPLRVSDWAVIVSAALIFTFSIEAGKLVRSATARPVAISEL